MANTAQAAECRLSCPTDLHSHAQGTHRYSQAPRIGKTSSSRSGMPESNAFKDGNLPWASKKPVLSLSKGCLPTSVALRPPRHGSFLGNLLKNMPFKWRGYIKPALSKLRAGYKRFRLCSPFPLSRFSRHYRPIACHAETPTELAGTVQAGLYDDGAAGG